MWRSALFSLGVLWCASSVAAVDVARSDGIRDQNSRVPPHLEVEEGEQVPAAQPSAPTGVKLYAEVVRGEHVSVQANVNGSGFNIPGDAANEPSLAVDPTAPNRISIGWRQFDSVSSSFRKAGWGFSRDGGRSWSFPGSLEEDVFRSDPVLDVDDQGRFYYYSLKGNLLCDLYLSDDGGATWYGEIPAYGGDKAWTAIDRTNGVGRGNYYISWSTDSNPWGDRVFTRSTDGGSSFMDPMVVSPAPVWGTATVGPEGELYIAGNADFDYDLFVLYRSFDAQYPGVIPTFEVFEVDLGGWQRAGDGPNPVGLLGQVWVAADHSSGPTRGNLYVLSSVNPRDSSDWMDVHFVRSEDGGETWSDPIRVHTDDRFAWQWFGTMSVAPNGRIDVVWVESLDGSELNIGELYYASSDDAGYTWSDAEPLSPSFDSFVGWPQQNKLGDYYHMVSDDVGAHLAYAATFNGEQDVYYLRIGDYDCNGNGVGDLDDLANARERDCNDNQIPDSCEIAAGAAEDSDGNGVIDGCNLPPPRSGRRIVP